MERLQIKKVSTPKALDERITVYFDSKAEKQRFLSLLNKTWPNKKVA